MPILLHVRCPGKQSHVAFGKEPVKIPVSVDVFVDQQGVLRSDGEYLFQSLVRRPYQSNQKTHAVLPQGIDGLLDMLCAESHMMNPGAIVVNELLGGPRYLIANVRRYAGGEVHGKVVSGPPGSVRVGVKCLE